MPTRLGSCISMVKRAVSGGNVVKNKTIDFYYFPKQEYNLTLIYFLFIIIYHDKSAINSDTNNKITKILNSQVKNKIQSPKSNAKPKAQTNGQQLSYRHFVMDGLNLVV